MKPTAIGMLVVLAILVIYVASRACRPECRRDGDCRPPLTCRAGKCRPAAALAPEGIKAPITCSNSQVAANIRMMVGADGQMPGACAMSADGAWLLYPTAWAEVPGSEISGSPKKSMTDSACARFCGSDPNCAAWVNDPASYCRAYSVVPGALVGNNTMSVGLKTAVLV